MTDCIFCKIVKGEVPADKVYEDDHSFAFLDISPVTAGHTLVIPKKHYVTIMDMEKEDLDKFMETVQKVSKAIEKYSEGVNLLQNNHEVAGQVVPHVHFHVIPRRAGDGVSIGHWHKAEGVDMEKVRGEIKSLLKE